MPGSPLTDRVRVYGKEMVLYPLKFAIGSSGAVSSVDTDFPGWGTSAIESVRGSVVRDSAGQYTIVLPGRGGLRDLIVVGDPAISINGNDLICEVESVTASTRTVVLQCKSPRGHLQHIKAAADGAAGDATAAVFFGVAGVTGVITAVTYTPNAALTADNDNYATVIVHNWNAGTDKTAASRTTQITGSGDWTAYVPVTITVSGTGANVAVTKGDLLSFEITKTGTGVAVPAGALRVFIEGAEDPASGDSISVVLLANNSAARST